VGTFVSSGRGRVTSFTVNEKIPPLFPNPRSSSAPLRNVGGVVLDEKNYSSCACGIPGAPSVVCLTPSIERPVVRETSIAAEAGSVQKSATRRMRGRIGFMACIGDVLVRYREIAFLVLHP